ncbi:MAG: disulfide bond formation protein B [Desulfarculaceae bacterium]|nr:disulfide bond formation protein B [Desulfarculaceae bacterium]MCF8074237.1 disulfide bond formation protein B [Desulfarculaceae bacterium]MCF8103004.1 disulfide bond formation protein B [Desulfarculaceae bacterium]MCF8117135.1 disulfide bond formation protein B [Desulfarculaceae bacterium]
MSYDLARKINLIFVLGIAGVLAGSLTIQFGGEYPCPLCILQRLAFVLMTMGPLLNLRFGVRQRHYAISLFAALFGMSVSVRQVLLHVVPGTGSYGFAVLNMHLYTWAFVIFFMAVLAVAVMLAVHKEAEIVPEVVQTRDAYVKVAFAVMGLIVAIMAVATLLECGWQCPDNPTGYKLL